MLKDKLSKIFLTIIFFLLSGQIAVLLLFQAAYAEDLKNEGLWWTRDACAERCNELSGSSKVCFGEENPQDNNKVTCLVPPPEVELSVDIGNIHTVKGISGYITEVFQWSIGALSTLAVIMIMVAGFQWVTAAGNASRIGQAKSRMLNAIIGLVLMLGSIILLRTINPDLVKLEGVQVKMIPTVYQSTFWCEDLPDELQKNLIPPSGKCNDRGTIGEGGEECVFDTCPEGQACVPIEDSSDSYICKNFKELCVEGRSGCQSDESIKLVEKYAIEFGLKESCRKKVVTASPDICAFARMWPKVDEWWTELLRRGFEHPIVHKRISCSSGCSSGAGDCTDDERANVVVDGICVASIFCQEKCNKDETEVGCTQYENEVAKAYKASSFRVKCQSLNKKCCIKPGLMKQ